MERDKEKTTTKTRQREAACEEALGGKRSRECAYVRREGIVREGIVCVRVFIAGRESEGELVCGRERSARGGAAGKGGQERTSSLPTSSQQAPGRKPHKEKRKKEKEK